MSRARVSRKTFSLYRDKLDKADDELYSILLAKKKNTKKLACHTKRALVCLKKNSNNNKYNNFIECAIELN